jgi:hypothetical protein
MERFSKLFLLSRNAPLLIQATSLLAAIRLGLRVLPFATLRTLLARLARTRHGTDGQRDGTARDRTIWAVETASRHFPAISTCLTQALAIHVLLARQGCKSILRIGVKRDTDGKFIAHAWLEKDGIILIGGAGHRSYAPMPGLNGLEP